MVQSKQAAGQPVVYVDMSTALSTADLSDSLHPNDSGYVTKSNAWNTAIQNVAGSILPPVSTGGRTGSIASGVAGKGLDAAALGTANGTALELWDCNGGANQRWTNL